MFDTGIEAVGTTHVGGDGVDWRVIDRQMRRLARRRAALDAEEAELIVAAKRAEIHKRLGYGSFAEYLERICGYAPTTARDRVRVAEALEQLPAMREALAGGEVTFSTVRELTRVATADTEEDWLVAIEGCTAREVEHAVRGHAVGDSPDDRPDPDLEPRVVRLELPPAVYALFLEARRVLERRVGAAMTDADFMGEACRIVLDGGNAAPDGNQPRHQIAISVCADCRRGWQDSGGTSVELAPAAIERARCDAVELGRVDGETVAERRRAIPAPIRRAVLARDHRRCTIPGCTSSVFVDVHHIQPRSAGGANTLRNLTTLCGLHHDAAHDGRLHISGSAGALCVTHSDGRPYGAEPTYVTDPRPPRPAPATEPPIAASTTGVPTPRSRVRDRESHAPVAASTPYVPTSLPAMRDRKGDASIVAAAPTVPASLLVDARGALTTLGFRRAEADAAVRSAAAHVGGAASLEDVIRAALRACPRPAS